MKMWNQCFYTLLLISGFLMAPVATKADDTEIYFSQATADNDENQVVANVFIMLDTSGSMRYCEESLGWYAGGGYNTVWCSDAVNRRINILQEALNQLLEDVSPEIHIGIGRFNYDTSGAGSGQKGGRVMVPVVPINSLTRPYFDAAIANVNDAGDADSAASSAAQPVGDTPTARAFSEAARYMMGRSVKYGTAANGATNPNICVAGEYQQVNCQQVPSEWGPWEVVDFCDASDTETCRFTAGSWQSVDFCNVNLDNCRYSNWSGWSDWFQSGSNPCNAYSAGLCQSDRWRPWANWYRIRIRSFEERNDIYESRTPLAFTEVCETVLNCTESQATVSGDSYVSPMNLNNQCESNHVILFTDGAPSGNDTPGNEANVVDCSGLSSYACQRKIATYLNSDENHKQRPVITHNIGLYMGGNKNNMESVSDDGGGSTINADNAEELLNAFLTTFELIDRTSRSMSSPGVAVNTLNRFQHLDQLYYSVFQPVESSYWDGNLKRYRLVGAEVHGVNGNAIDADTGYFNEMAQSYWSSSVDGSDVEEGGARERLSNRKLFYVDAPGGNTELLDWAGELPNNAFFGVDNDTERANMMAKLQTNWGDPLHSAPVMVNYGVSADNNVVFVSTNAGMLHAIETQTGDELSSFMPFEMISKANLFTIDQPPLSVDNTRQVYGLDSSWTVWRKSGGSLTAAPEHVYLYGGMRRGGRHLYALDVTDPEAPELLWQISNETVGYEDLGQTWSVPTLTQIPTPAGPVPVIVVGGGYSPDDHDNLADRKDGDQMGNAVYFINAITGAKIWSVGGSANVDKTVADMKWAVPSSIAVVDLDFDGVADHLYFGDLGGQVFRISMKGFDPVTDAPLHEVVRLADLGGSGANHRRFYEAPAVALLDKQLYVAIGSGYRAHPLDEVTDEAFFVIKDPAALGTAAHVEATLLNLTDVTDVTILPAASDRGWYYFLETGEKVLAPPIIFRGKILFTTYQPTIDQEFDDPCSVRYGASFIHTVGLKSGQPSTPDADPDDPDAEPETGKRRSDLDQSTPPPSPTLIVNDDGEVVVLVGTEVVGEEEFGDSALRKRRWMQLPPNEANEIILNKSPVDEPEADNDDGSADDGSGG